MSTPTLEQFLAAYPEFRVRGGDTTSTPMMQAELESAIDELTPSRIPAGTWNRAVFLLTAHELELRRGGGTQGGRGAGAVTSRSAGSVSSSFAVSKIPEPWNATVYGVKYYRAYVARYGVLRFTS